MDKRQVIHRRQQRDMLHALEQAIDRLLYIRVQMHRINDLHIAACSKLFQCIANVFEGLPKILASMGGDEE